MSPRSSGMWGLLGTGFRGLRSRMLLTLGSILLAGISVGAAVVGPMYQDGAASSYLVTKLGSEPNFLTGVVFDYHPSLDPTTTYADEMAAARRRAAAQLNPVFGPPTLAMWSERFNGFPGYGAAVALVSAAGECDHVILTGRCPTKVGEALILKHDSAFAPLKVGQSVRLLEPPQLGQSTPPAKVRPKITIVGTYAPRAVDEDYWFNLLDLESVPPQPTAAGMTPYRPAPLLVAPETFGQLRPQTWTVHATRRLVVTSQTTLADLQSATRAVAALAAHQHHGELIDQPGGLTPEGGNTLEAISQEVQQRRATARSTVTPAVVSVILVALVLLFRLLSAAMELRRSELALASLRGFSRRQMWVLGMLEPVLMLVIATPLGLLVGYLSARALGRAWLVPGLPMPVPLGSLVAMVGVVVATLVVAALVVRDSVGEPLSSQIAGVRRPTKSGRWSLLLQLVVVAAAVTVLVATLASSSKSSPDATDLALPILLATAAGLLTTILAQFLGRSWARWTAQRRGVFGYVASRTISRRREGTLVILPLTAALAISVFAAGVYTAAADWRASDAATLVGADVSYETQLSMDQAVALTHQIDPDGKWLMAIAAEHDGANEMLVMDTPRLARVGLWPSSWTPGSSAADISSELSVNRSSVRLVGSQVSVTLDNRVTGDFKQVTATLHVTTAAGSRTSIVVGPFPRGVSTATARVTGCAAGCEVTQLSFGGPGGLTGVMHGEARITAIQVDGTDVPGALDESWRIWPSLFNTPIGVQGEPQLSGGALVVRFDAKSANSYASITPTDVPAVRPVVLGRQARPPTVRRTGDDLKLRDELVNLTVHPVATAESMPVLGPAGMLIDYTMFTRDMQIIQTATFVTILSRSDTPAAVVSALADNGISKPQTLTAARVLLDQDAFARALNLYLVVVVIVILLALAGLGANLAVQMPARRRDAASLRVVGLRRRSIVSAVVAEFLVVLGSAALAGVAAGVLAQYVVVRTVTLGYADTMHTPRLLASLNLGAVTDLLIVVTAVLFVVAVTVGALTVRGARTASLRENAR